MNEIEYLDETIKANIFKQKKINNFFFSTCELPSQTKISFDKLKCVQLLMKDNCISDVHID